VERLIQSCNAGHCCFVCFCNGFVFSHETASTLVYNLDQALPQGSVHGANGNRDVLLGSQKAGVQRLALTFGCIGSAPSTVGSSVGGVLSLLFLGASGWRICASSSVVSTCQRKSDRGRGVAGALARASTHCTVLPPARLSNNCDTKGCLTLHFQAGRPRRKG
jgi:hypothetical protein